MKAESGRRIRIFDTTLRDGEQTPGVSFTPEEKLEIAYQLDKLGVDVIEAGTPIGSEGEKRAIKEITKAGLNAEICALARVLEVDIEAAVECEVDTVHTFVSTSEVQMKHAVDMSREQVLSKTVESIEYIKEHGVICEFSPMDATRTDLDFLIQVCVAAEEAGADIINIPDTVGVMRPVTMRDLISEVVKEVKIPISVHCHNDFGLAVANSLAGIEAGASQVHVSINGLGERAGNAALEEIVSALHLIYNHKTGIKTELIYETSRLVSRLTGVIIQPNKAIVGENAFSHESGIHTKGVTEVPSTFEPIKPEYVGRKRKLIPGKLAGFHGIKAGLEEIGLHPSEGQLREIVKRIKHLGDKGKTVTDEDVLAITRAVTGMVVEEEKAINLIDLGVLTGINITPTASVKVKLDEEEYVAAETGVGPVDAAIKAIQKLIKPVVDVKLNEYRLEAITGGSNAIAEVMVKVEDGKGTITSATGAREDIVMASVEAMITGINKLLLRRNNL
ncbi:MAG: 2-isopropylmalate synthase [Thermoproteota archaeon]